MDKSLFERKVLHHALVCTDIKKLERFMIYTMPKSRAKKNLRSRAATGTILRSKNRKEANSKQNMKAELLPYKTDISKNQESKMKLSKKSSPRYVPKPENMLDDKAEKQLIDLTRLGYSFEGILKGASVNSLFLTETYRRLKIPINCGNEPHKRHQNLSCNDNDCYLNTESSTKNDTNHSTTMLDTTNGLGFFNRNSMLPPSGPNVTVTSKSHINKSAQPFEESLESTLFDSTSHIFMQLRLDLLKLKNMIKGQEPRFSADKKSALLKKKLMLTTELDNFFDALGLHEENSQTVSKNASTTDTADIFHSDSSDSVSITDSHYPSSKESDNESDKTVDIIEDSVIKLKKSKPDHFTPYKSLNLIKRLPQSTDDQ